MDVIGRTPGSASPTGEGWDGAGIASKRAVDAGGERKPAHLNEEGPWSASAR
jgi:hypothetical protein